MSSHNQVLTTILPVDRQTARIRRRYDRLAPFYGRQMGMKEDFLQKYRRLLWSRLGAARILEVGVGAGANMLYYPAGARVTAIDFSAKMLEIARRRAQDLGKEVDLQLMDAQHLVLHDQSFDAAVTTCVFCSVPDPIQGLRELGRVVRPGGDIWLLEHMRVDKPLIGLFMDLLNPLVVRMMGANINRRTVEHVRLAGLEIESVENLIGTLLRLIHAHPASK